MPSFGAMQKSGRSARKCNAPALDRSQFTRTRESHNHSQAGSRMLTPGEHKTVQARILAYAQQVGWTYVPRGEADRRRGFDHAKATPAEQAAEASPYFDDLL